MTVPVMMGIASPTGSHLPTLEAAVAGLSAGSLVIEHGAGMYSTPLLCRSSARVLCLEVHPGWAEWARWMYMSAGIEHEIAGYKQGVPRMAEAALVFIDGEAKERGLLLAACLERRVPIVIAHDTEQHTWQHYGIHPHLFEWRGYRIEHFAEDTHRTTQWTLSS